jgi:hypothetical protein
VFGEQAENVERKDFAREERVVIGLEIEKLLGASASARQARGPKGERRPAMPSPVGARYVDTQPSMLATQPHPHRAA